MELSLTREQIEIQKEARRFFEAEVMPHAIAVDRGEKSIFDHWPKIAAQGYMASMWPEAYGGSEVDSVSAALIAIELAKACGSTSLSQGASTLLAGGAIFHHGTEEQKKKYLPRIASGKSIGAWGLTEPGAGSDVLGIQTRAREVDGGFVLDGAKTFITNAPVADIFIVYAWTDEKEAHHGMSAFVIERGTKGLTTSAPMHKMGFRGSPTGEIFLSDCFVPKECLLGQRGMGFYEATDCLNAERAMAPCLAIGFIERSLELCLRYTRQRHAFGRPIASFQAMQLKMARMYVDMEHCRGMLYRLLWMRDQGMPFVKEASAAKVFSSEAAVRNALEAIQIHGGYGYTEEFEVERIMRDAKLLEIGAGTTEIQLLLIARMLTGEAQGRAEETASAAATAASPAPPASPAAPAPASGTEAMAAPRASISDLGAADIMSYLAGAYRPEGAPGWKAAILFELSGASGGTFRLIVDGTTATMEKGEGPADTTIVATADDWKAILLGKLNAQKAFFLGKLKVKGNISNAMMLSNGKVFQRPEGITA